MAGMAVAGSPLAVYPARILRDCLAQPLSAKHVGDAATRFALFFPHVFET